MEYIPQKHMVQADYLNFTVKREMQSWQRAVEFHFAMLKRVGAVHKEICRSCLVLKGFVCARTHKQGVRCGPSPKREECRQRLQSMFEKAGAHPADIFRYVLVGAPRNLVSVDGEYSVDLAINGRLIESGSESCFDEDDRGLL